MVLSTAATTVCHRLYVGSLLERLVEPADMARDILVALNREGDNRLHTYVSTYSVRDRRDREGGTYHPAEGEEGAALEHAAGHVAAVVALADDALVAGELLADGLFAAHEEEEHGGRWVDALRAACRGSLYSVLEVRSRDGLGFAWLSVCERTTQRTFDIGD